MKAFIFLLPAFVLLAISCKKQNTALTFKNNSYGSDARNKMDVYLPQQRDTNTALVILIHGGGWVAGDKSDWSQEIINEFTDAGYAVSAINYRYACGDFRKQMEDIKNAIEYIRSKAGEWKISGSKFGLVGGSAGGHLSLLYAHAYDSANVVKTVVSIVGPTDMTDPVFHQYANNWGIGYVFQAFLGSTFQSNPQVYRDASPLYNFSNVPSFFIHGALDNLVPPQQGISMYDSLVLYGFPADTTFFNNAGHDVFGPAQVNKQQVYDEVKVWLNMYLVN